MKSYHLKSKPNRVLPKRIVAIILFFLFLSLCLYFFPNGLRTAGNTVARPIWTIGNSSKNFFSNTSKFLGLRGSLVSQNQALADEVNSLKLKEADYDLLLKENLELKTELGRPEASTKILAAVLSKPPVSPFDTFVIDLGSKRGLTEGERVYLGGNVIIGKVKSVTASTALVELFSSRNVKQEATLSRTGASFVLEGHGGANYVLEVPKEADIVWGDVFLYPDLNSSILGSVYFIDTNSQSSFKTIYIRMPGNVFNSKYVFVERI